jgi:hypothetical protein
MEIQELYYASVIDNNYKSVEGVAKQNGRIKIKVEELHANTTPTLLPWARPFILSTGGGNLQGVSNIPEIGSKVWIFFSDAKEGIFRKSFYIADGSLDDFNPHSLFSSNVASALGSASIYPNAKYYYFKNGICIGVDSSSANPEMFIYHPYASFFIDKTGQLSIKALKINLLGGNGTPLGQPSVLGTTLQTILNLLITTCAGITVTCAAPGVTVPTNNAAVFTAMLTQLSTMLSTVTTNN